MTDHTLNRFDRVTSLLLLLQTRSVVTAKFLAGHFNVTERTIYRDIRTLENAGVPIGSEAGVGYFLEQGYRLPPVSFTLDEAASLLLGEKLLATSLDTDSLKDFKQALNKVRAVIDKSDKDYLSSLDADIEVIPTGSHFPIDETTDTNQADNTENANTDQSVRKAQSSDHWLRECRTALVRRQVIEIEYSPLNTEANNTRQLEPIGLFYYSWHWHLIAWCRLREDYRDFRLDRISALQLLSEQFARHSRLTLKQYLDNRPGENELQEVELLFGNNAARFVGEQRYMFGYVEEERLNTGIKMRFLTHVPEYMSRWLLQYIDDVEVLKGESIKNALHSYSKRLAEHWHSNPS